MIRLTGIKRQFQLGGEYVHALHEVNLHFEPGDYAAIMGPSGSGKSTLLNILGLLDRPNAGEYQLAGVNTTDLTDDEQADVRRDTIGFVFQSFHLIPRLTAAENIEIPLILAGVDAEKRSRRLSKALESVGLTDRAHHRPDQLSGGQRQRVAIARAIIMEPSIILADEPTGNLDHSSGAAVIKTLERLNEAGMTLLIVTHDPALGQRARRQIHLMDGRVTHDLIGPTHRNSRIP
jgi:putative ABC transport system ATP-binding protein